MAREKELFRENLALLNEYFGGKQVLSIQDVVNYTGLGRKFVKKHYEFDKFNTISVTKLASALS